MKQQAVAAFALICVGACALAETPSPARPFSDRSLWNARPVRFVLGSVAPPKAEYFPTVAEGAYSVRVFEARPSDPPVTVRGNGDDGIFIADAETMASSVVIPHWPADVASATGEDGHADIVDAMSNRIHSFYQLRRVGDQWRAAQYTWSALDGPGWGDPAHYFQGSRAAGVPTMAGLIRTAEVNDGRPVYRHALAMSMAFNGLSPNPAYTYPATAADINAARLNHGTIPEGALMMLPADFDLAQIKNAALRKIVRTLQTYGAYVVDANLGTPFLIYVEIGSGFQLMKPGTWDGEVGAELDRIRDGLRQVVSVTDWVDANGKPFAPSRAVNLLSMRGPWASADASPIGQFDSWQQAVVFPDNGRRITQTNASGRSMQPVDWAIPRAGEVFRLTVSSTAGASLEFSLVDGSGRQVFTSGPQGDGMHTDFPWPNGSSLRPVVVVTAGVRGGGKVGATLRAMDGKS